jgi:hypothetical protein
MKAASFAALALIAIAGSASAQTSQKPATGEVPADQRPPKGMCRIWLKDVPAAQQPAATDCAAAVKNCPPNGRVIFGETEETKNKPKVDPKAVPDPKQSTPVVKTFTRKPPIQKKPPVDP